MAYKRGETYLKHGINNIIYIYVYKIGWVAQSVQRLNMGVKGPGSNPGGDEMFRPFRPTLGPNPNPCVMGTGSFPGVEAAGS